MRNRHLLFGFLTVIFGLSTLAFASANAMTIKNTKTNNAQRLINIFLFLEIIRKQESLN